MLRHGGIVGCRLYSSGNVTNDFLQQILARAQEATSIKAMVLKKQEALERTNQNKRRTRRRGIEGMQGRRINDDMNNRNTVYTKVKKIGENEEKIFNKQPQFKKKFFNNDVGSNLNEGGELLDAFEPKDYKFSKSSKTKIFNKKREVPGLNNKRFGSSNENSFAIQRKAVVSETYIPQEPTPLSLLKYYPQLANTANSRLVNFAINAMKEVNYPLNRQVNFGVSTSGEAEDVLNTSFTCSSESYGSYEGGNSIILQREKLFKNLKVTGDLNQLEASVNGKYRSLPTLNANTFQNIAKTTKKIDELLHNSKIVKLSLENNNPDIPLETKELLFNICSGTKPVSGLTH